MILKCSFGVIAYKVDGRTYSRTDGRSPTPAHLPKTYILAHSQAWKTPPFHGFWRKKTPFFNRNRWFWGPINTLYLNKSPFNFRYIRWSTLFVKARLIVPNIFPCTSHFPLRLIWSEYLYTRLRSNVWKLKWKQAGTCKLFTFSNFRGFMPKITTPFIFWANEALVVEFISSLNPPNSGADSLLMGTKIV